MAAASDAKENKTGYEPYQKNSKGLTLEVDVGKREMRGTDSSEENLLRPF